MVYWYANIRRVGVETKNMRLKVLKRKTEKLQPYLKISMVVLIILYLVISVLFRYEDTVSYTVWSVNFWDLLFQGRLGDYYSYSHENLRQAPHGLFCGSYLTVFPWILWNFPLWLTHPISQNVRVDSVACIFYSKLLLLLCVIGIAFYVYRIAKVVFRKSDEQACLAAILSVGGYEIVNSTAYAGQDEVVYLFFILAAVYFLLAGRKRMWLLFSCMSITVCPIMLIPFLTVYLIYEKNILKILGGTGMVLIPSLFFEFVYHSDEIYQESKGINSTSIFESMMDGDRIGTALGTVSAVGVAIILVFFLCYIIHEEGQNQNVSIIYMLAVSFFIICFMSPLNVFYRFGIYTPFWAVLIVLYEDRLNINLFLMTVVNYGRAFVSLGYSLSPDPFMTQNWNLTQNWNSQFIFPEIKTCLGEIRMRAVSEMMVDILGSQYYTVLFIARTMVFAGAIILLLINWKRWDKEISFQISYRMSMVMYTCSNVFFFVAFVVCILS